MPSTLTLCALLAAVTLCVSGAPLQDALTDGPAGGESSGEEVEEVKVEVERGGVETSNLTGPGDILENWKQGIAPISERHEKEFNEEFQGNVNYTSLQNYTRPSFPTTNFSKKAYCQELAQGLLTYLVLLKHVEKEYPKSSVLPGLKGRISLLVTQFKAKMRKRERAEEPTGTEQEALLRELDHPDTYTRRLRAHSVLASLRNFLVDGKRLFQKWEAKKRQTAGANRAV
ncbi:interleukin-6-like [Kryptolebias marmoratus]|uniref:interleukin-6-like n=1 Tax=Kryptolebias marmoratus TaxID=37003 RepID=UPI0007F8E451|nr:interleukin-6-like [Kryptolebias marmoratus]